MADIITALTAFGPLTVSLLVAVIAARQWGVAKNQLKLNLFDRRYKVFDATRKFLAGTCEVNFSEAHYLKFFAETSEAEFLFGPEVVRYLAEIRKRSIDRRRHQTAYENQQVGDKRNLLMDAETNELNWLANQITEMSKTFRPYLGFSHIK